jgi:hypothetical protein
MRGLLDPSSVQPSPSIRTHLWIPDSLLFGTGVAYVGRFIAASVWPFKRTIDLVHAGANGLIGARLRHFGPWAIVLVRGIGVHGGTRLPAGDSLVVAGHVGV